MLCQAIHCLARSQSGGAPLALVMPRMDFLRLSTTHRPICGDELLISRPKYLVGKVPVEVA